MECECPWRKSGHSESQNYPVGESVLHDASSIVRQILNLFLNTLQSLCKIYRSNIIHADLIRKSKLTKRQSCPCALYHTASFSTYFFLRYYFWVWYFFSSSSLVMDVSWGNGHLRTDTLQKQNRFNHSHACGGL